jgi:hypothetical protein
MPLRPPLPQAKEEFFVVAWSQHPTTRTPLLLVAGKHGVLHAIDCGTQSLFMVSWRGGLSASSGAQAWD